MKRLNNWIILILVVLALNGAMIAIAFAKDKSYKAKVIVIFEEGMSEADRLDYAFAWAPKGVTVVMDLPFMNGMVLRIPKSMDSTILADDPRVIRVEDDRRMGMKNGFKVEAQAVAAADGGAADGGAADGGAADGGAADGGAADGGAADGGAADGGAADGGAKLPAYIKPFRDLGEDQYPWGTLMAYGEEFKTSSLVGYLDDDEPDSEELEDALEDLEEERVKVALMDTGVNFNHPRLHNSIKGGIDLVNMVPGIPMDDNGHGTHIAGTLCASGMGVAPGVELYVIKVLDSKAEGDISNLVMGLQWAISNQMDIVSMSLAYRDNNEAVRLAVQKASEEGLIMVAAVGNLLNWEDATADGGAADGGAADGGAADGGAADGGAADGGAADGGAADGGAADGGAADGGAADGGAADGGAADGGAADGGAADGGAADGGAADGGAADDGGVVYEKYTVMYPAKYPEVIAVSAHDAYGFEASFANLGPETDLLAPGVNIVSTVFGDDFGLASGTSMAVPHVAGTIALMLAVDPSLSPEYIKKILMGTAENGLLRTDNAVELVENMDDYWDSDDDDDDDDD